MHLFHFFLRLSRLAVWLLPALCWLPAVGQRSGGCDYTTSSVTLTPTGGTGSGTVRYVLADSTGRILQVSSTPTFSGLTGSHSYTALAISHDGSAVNLTAGQALSAVSAGCYDWSDALPLRVCVPVSDADGDGVPDDRDRCPGTPTGTPVNAYGCPRTRTTCDYSGSSITLTSAGGAGNGTVRYVLADSTGRILQVNASPAFSGLSGSRTYMALALSYDGQATNLTAGQALSAVSAGCLDWSDALLLKVCVPTSTDCDYTVGSPITLRSTGGTSATGTQTRYVLENSAGLIVQVGQQPSFATTGLPAGLYRAYSIVYTDSQPLTLQTGAPLTVPTGYCVAQSDPLPLRLCTDCVPKCIPITAIRSRVGNP